MALLIDTHVLVWIGEGHPRLKPAVRDRLFDPDEALCVSAVTAFEYADLRERGRIPRSAALDELQDRLQLAIIDYPAALWPLAATLPPIHRDPVDRMLVAHALALEMPLVTADANIARYPGLDVVWE
jgi:PIN domain nuclease of toxin-antitoxin system